MNKAIYWFRKNLRINDNPSLYNAIKENDEVICIYIKNYSIYNPSGIDIGNMGSFRKKFLDESIIDLKKNLKKAGIDLYIFDGDTLEVFQEIKSEYSSKKIYASKEVGWYEEEEEKELRNNNFNLNLYDDQFLIESKDLPYQVEELPLIFTHFRKKVEKLVKIRDLVGKVNYKNTIEKYKFRFQSEVEIENLKTHKNSNFPFKGGESQANQRLKSYLWETNGIKTYKETRNGLVGTEYSSKISAYLSLGCLSPVTVYHEIKKYEKEVTKNSSTYWLIFEILWREFFRYVYLKARKNIFIKDGINGNIFNKNFKNDLDLFDKWKNGKTGQDFIDANMIELKETGFMSNRGRQNVASYLVNNLDLNWVLGASYFEKQLIDYDVTSNWCNWMYISGVGNNVKNWVFNPVRQSEMYDKHGFYREIWLNKKIGQQNLKF
tara:strand:+ start:1331 stop:2632 length:1302 start_codon:yes stop_codon:yes gene_type:complete